MIKYKIIELLNNKNIKFTESSKWGQYLRGVWEENFAEQLSADEKKKIYLEQYLWHVFSYKKILCLKNDQAIMEFNKVIKSQRTCYIFFQHSDLALIVESSSSITSEDLEYDDDIYIVDKGFTWTYIQTHEEQCGPYFSTRI
ncbi:hypothetical protein PAESOLCIP111_00006 [Paenibacillus solanacearum]|uniref:DUF4275 family protein n=1 Tax=Paenibacillus solanacearum TaxID=2048548 RepID=A0A916JQJ6_9BACL|nr:DUF4275 family protein [Paenibacillus solanacearum]CAG7594692.1 hypothetical protein PAESOLCIP111_00006 [Paenibacillus solanacearum]